MLEIGTMLSGRYEVLKRVGSGGMADVYMAKDHKLNRNVAVKVLKSEYVEDEKFLKKFEPADIHQLYIKLEIQNMHLYHQMD